MTMNDRPWDAAVVTRLAGQAWVMGLDWRSPPDGDIRRAAAEAVADAPGSLAAIRRRRLQYGLGPAAARGAVAAAAVLAEGRSGAWIGVWALPDGGYWGVAARYGTLYPIFGDVVLADRADADDWLARHARTAAWDEIFAPAGWAGATASAASLADLLARRRRGPVLRDPRRPSIARVAAVAAAAAVVSGTALIVHDHWIAGPAPTPRPLSPAAALPPLPPPPAHPVAAALEACLAGLGRALAAGLPAGWTPGPARCAVAGGHAVTETALRARDDTPLALAAAPRPASMTIDLERRTARAEHRAPLPPASPLAAVSPDNARLALVELAETLGGGLGRDLVLAARDPAFDSQTNAPPQWSRLDWTLVTAAPPKLWMPGLTALPGVALAAIGLEADRRRWRVSGWIVTETANE